MHRSDITCTQTIAQSMLTKKQKVEDESKRLEGCILIIELKETDYEILKEEFVTTSSSCCEVMLERLIRPRIYKCREQVLH